MKVSGPLSKSVNSLVGSEQFSGIVLNTVVCLATLSLAKDTTIQWPYSIKVDVLFLKTQTFILISII